MASQRRVHAEDVRAVLFSLKSSMREQGLTYVVLKQGGPSTCSRSCGAVGSGAAASLLVGARVVRA